MAHAQPSHAPADAAPEAPLASRAAARHAAFLAGPQAHALGPAQRARLMRQLQRGGNSYVERVVARAQGSGVRGQGSGSAEGGTAEQEVEAPAVVAGEPAAAPAAPPADESSVRRFSLGDLSPAKALLRKVAGLARNLPGYSMLGLALGRDPISGDAVERSPKNLLRAIMGLVPVVGEQLFLAMDEAGAIDKAFSWADAQLKQLGLSFDLIKATFSKAWDALSLKDAILDPGGTWAKLKAIFLGPINTIRAFVGAAMEKVKQFIFEAVLERLGGGPVMGVLQKAGGAIGAIIKDPIGFVGNLIKGVGQGFTQFGANILSHLKKGLFSWLFGELGAAGIQLPKSLDLSGILDLVLQALGLTWGFLRAQAVKVLGEPVVQKAESAFKIFVVIKEQGLGGLWEHIKEQLGNLKEMVFDAVKDMVASQVVQAGVQWLLSMLGGPAGALVKAIKAIYDVVMWFVNNASRIMALIRSVGDSIGAIVAGNLGQAAGFIERALAQSIPVLIGFLANLLGLGGLSQKIRGAIEKLQAPVRKALGLVLGKLKGWAKKLWGRVKAGTGRARDAIKQKLGVKEKPPEVRLNKGLSTGVKAVNTLKKVPLAGAHMLSGVLKGVKGLYGLSVLEPVERDGYWAVYGEVQRMANPAKTKQPVAKFDKALADKVGKKIQKITNKVRKQLFTGSKLTSGLLTSGEREIEKEKPFLDKANFGKAVEGAVDLLIAIDPELSKLVIHVGGAGRIDFQGIGPIEGAGYEITTDHPDTVRAHELRTWFDKNRDRIIIYKRLPNKPKK